MTEASTTLSTSLSGGSGSISSLRRNTSRVWHRLKNCSAAKVGSGTDSRPRRVSSASQSARKPIARAGPDLEEPARQVGEFRRLGDHDAIDRQADLGQHHLDHALADAAQHLRRIVAIMVGAVERMRQELVAFLTDIGGEQGGLAVESNYTACPWRRRRPGRSAPCSRLRIRRRRIPSAAPSRICARFSGLNATLTSIRRTIPRPGRIDNLYQLVTSRQSRLTERFGQCDRARNRRDHGAPLMDDLTREVDLKDTAGTSRHAGRPRSAGEARPRQANPRLHDRRDRRW